MMNFSKHVERMHQATIKYARGAYSHLLLGGMTRLISKGGLRDSILMSLVYMRWLDDVADESDMGSAQKKALLKKSLAFLERCRAEEFDFLTLTDLHVEERCAYFFMKDIVGALKSRGAPQSTIDGVIGGYTEMIRSILQDVQNMNRLMRAKEFYDQVYYLKAGVGFRTTAYILYNDPSPRVLDAFRYFGYIWQMNNDIPDVAKDLRCGLINMTREEVENAGVRLRDWKGREDELAKYLEERTSFFKDRTAKLQEWKKLVEAGFPDMDPWFRFLVKKYLKIACPIETFDSRSVHYKVISAGDYLFNNGKPGTEGRVHIFNILPLFLPERMVLFLYDVYFRRAATG